MPPLIPCPACARHVYSSETECPFCEAKLPRRRSVGPGLAAAAGAGLALMATGCPDREQADVYGAPPPSADDPAPVDSGDSPDYRDDIQAEYGAPPPPAEPLEPPDYRDDIQAEYGAPPPPPPDPEPLKPLDDDREQADVYGAPPPPEDELEKPVEDPDDDTPPR